MKVWKRILATRAPGSVILIRAMVGLVFVSEGLQKFIFPDQLGPGRFEKIGFAHPNIAYFVACFEVTCGVLLVLGLLTRLAAIPLIIVMLTAITTTKLPILVGHDLWGFHVRKLPDYGFWAMAHEARTDWAMLLGSLFLLIVGGGRWSMDTVFTERPGPLRADRQCRDQDDRAAADSYNHDLTTRRWRRTMMRMRPNAVSLKCGVAILVLAVTTGCESDHASTAPGSSEQVRARRDSARRPEEIEKRLAHLEALAPGQGTLMTLVGYHFGNLWFALEYENWPLAAFYLHESRETLEQAVDAKPIRKLSTGEDLNIRGIAEALDNTQFTDLEKAIAAKEKARAQAAYRDAMIVCHSCHLAAEMPFLRLQMPDKPPSILIQFDPTRPE